MALFAQVLEQTVLTRLVPAHCVVQHRRSRGRVVFADVKHAGAAQTRERGNCVTGVASLAQLGKLHTRFMPSLASQFPHVVSFFMSMVCITPIRLRHRVFQVLSC